MIDRAMGALDRRCVGRCARHADAASVAGAALPSSTALSTVSSRRSPTIRCRRACRQEPSPTTPNRRCCSAASCVESGERFDHERWVNALLDWERDVKARGSYDLLGPSTKRAIDAINDGVPPEEAGRGGDTNGAAMRIAPVGIMMPLEPLDALVAKVAETCRATHNTSIAIASAAAVAAAVSRGVAGGDWRAASDQAVAGGEARRRRSATGSPAATSPRASTGRAISSAASRQRGDPADRRSRRHRRRQPGIGSGGLRGAGGRRRRSLASGGHQRQSRRRHRHDRRHRGRHGRRLRRHVAACRRSTSPGSGAST